MKREKRPLHMEVKVGSDTDNIKTGTEQGPDKYSSSTKSSDVENEELWKTIFRITRQNGQFTWKGKL